MEINHKIDINDLIDLLIKFLGLFSILIGLVQYRITWKREFAKKAYEARFEYYSQVMKYVSNIINIGFSDPEYKKQKSILFQLLKGKMLLVQSIEVEERIESFLRKLENYENEPTSINRNYLYNNSYELAHTLRNDLAISWGVDFFKKDRFYDATQPPPETGFMP